MVSSSHSSLMKILPDIIKIYFNRHNLIHLFILSYRYRTVKRLVRRSSNVFIKDPCELETIPEGAEIQLTLASPQHRINIEMNSSPSRILDQADLMPVTRSCLPKELSDDETDTKANEPNLHAMSRYGLIYYWWAPAGGPLQVTFFAYK